MLGLNCLAAALALDTHSGCAFTLEFDPLRFGVGHYGQVFAVANRVQVGRRSAPPSAVVLSELVIPATCLIGTIKIGIVWYALGLHGRKKNIMNDERPTSRSPGKKSFLERLGDAFTGEPKDRDELLAIIHEAHQNKSVLSALSIDFSNNLIICVFSDFMQLFIAHAFNP